MAQLRPEMGFIKKKKKRKKSGNWFLFKKRNLDAVSHEKRPDASKDRSLFCFLRHRVLSDVIATSIGQCNDFQSEGLDFVSVW